MKLQKLNRYFWLASASVASVPVFAVGTADAQIQSAVDNASATFVVVSGAIIAIVATMIGIKFLRRIR